MDGIIIPIIGSIVGVILGFVIAKFLEKNKSSQIINRAKKEATNILKESKTNANVILKEAKIEADGLKQDKILQAKEKFIELKSEHEKHIQRRESKVLDAEKRIREKESRVSQQLDKNKKLNTSLEEKEADFDYKLSFVDKKKTETEKLHKQQVKQLEVLSGLSAEDAKSELVKSLKELFLKGD